MDRLLPGLIATFLGCVALLVVFVPLVVLGFRRRGGFSAARMLGWIALLFYALGLQAYTLLPLPADTDYSCVGAVLNPFEDLLDVVHRQAGGSSLLHNPAFQQLALNIVLFVPLGVFVRLLFGRGVLVAIAAGALVSLTVELTQLTGIWGVYPCAYRVFDTGDVASNTIGAALGALAALPIARRARPVHPDPGGRPISAWRRLTAMTVDALSAWFVALAVAAAFIAVLAALDVDGPWASGAVIGVVATLVVIAAQAISVLADGATIGERAAYIDVAESRRPAWAWRLARLACGIGGYLVLSLLPSPWSISAFALAVACFVAAFTSRGHRGFGQSVAGMDSRTRASRPAEATSRR